MIFRPGLRVLGNEGSKIVVAVLVVVTRTSTSSVALVAVLVVPWCMYKLLYFGVTLLWKLLWLIIRNSKLFRPSPTLRLNFISIMS